MGKTTLISIVNSLKNRNKISAIAFIALMVLPLAFVASAFAKTYTAMPPRATTTAVGVSPTLVRLGQQVFINILTYPAPSGPTYYAQNLVGVYPSAFTNISCTITMPDGTQSTFMPVDMSLANIGVNIPGAAQVVGSLMFYWTPTQVGNYSISANFPGQTFTTDSAYANMNLSVLYQGSSSQATKFAVQQNTVLGGIENGYPWSPLPTGYWTNPIYTNNREWAAISGPWVQSNYNYMGDDYNPYSTAPSTPHVLWTSTVDGSTAVGGSGLAGGAFGSLAYTAGSGGTANIILDGNIYQSGYTSSANTFSNGGTPSTPTQSYFECISLRTGQLLWTAPGSINGAWQFLPAYQTVSQENEGGVTEVLWGGLGTANWIQYSPVDGHVVRNITGAPTLSNYRYDNGNPIFWCVQTGPWNTTNPLNLAYCNLIKWNYTKLTTTVGMSNVNSNNWANGIMWNVSCMLPTSSQVVSPGAGNFASVNAYPFDAAGVVVVQPHNDMAITEGFSESSGQMLWVNNNTAIGLNGANILAENPNGPSINDAAGQFVAYNVQTGQQTWTASTGNLPWALLPSFLFIDNNNTFYYGSYDGHVYAVNDQTGAPVWTSDYVGATDETIYGNQPFNGAAVGANGILYFSTSTTYSLEPRTRFHALYAINQTTGHFLWTLPIDINPTSIAYGYLVGKDSEDGIQYCFGKGQTTTTVTAQQQIGGSMLIQGSVMDNSPGSPNTPAISDANMSVWMDYLYGQNATLINSPPDCNGVPVTLTAVDPNGKAIDIGTVTSDGSGHFGYQWNPTTPGLYTIYATFGGSGSYWSSYTETSATVASATVTATPTSTTTASTSATPDYTTAIIASAIAVIAAVAIVGIVVVRSVRQK